LVKERVNLFCKKQSKDFLKSKIVWTTSGYFKPFFSAGNLGTSEVCQYILADSAEAQNILSYLENYSPVDGVFVNGQLDEISFQNIQLTNDALVAFIKINGNVSITVDGL
jgi:hypothetical protein